MTDLFDEKHLALYVGDDISLRNEILIIYEQQLETWSEKLNIHMDDKDWYLAAHTLKGASRGVGVWCIGDLCEVAEALCGDFEGKLDQRADFIEKLLSDISKVSIEISKLCDEVVAA